MATKFISSVIRKLTDKYPHLNPTIAPSIGVPPSEIKKKGGEVPKTPKSRTQPESAAI